MSTWRDLDEFLKNHIKNGPAGCGCAVAKDGNILFENYYGCADIDKHRTSNTSIGEFGWTGSWVLMLL